MNTLSVVIITLNEEAKIGRCLESVKNIADEIIVVDSNSTDGTEAICKPFNVRFVTQAWLGYSAQKNLADDLATCDLILSIDGDEALSEMLLQSIAAMKTRPVADNEVFTMNRLNNYCGQWMRRCGLYPDCKARIWRRGFATWQGEIHETLQYAAKPKMTHLDGDLLHYSYDTPEAFERQLFRFAEMNGKAYFENKKKNGLFSRIFSPSFSFIRNYLFKGGILEGKTGLHICRTIARATRRKYQVLHALIKQQGKK